MTASESVGLSGSGAKTDMLLTTLHIRTQVEELYRYLFTKEQQQNIIIYTIKLVFKEPNTCALLLQVSCSSLVPN